MTVDRYATLRNRAERYARGPLGWPHAEAVDARPVGDGRAVAVLIDPVPHVSGTRPFVIAFDEGDRIATDAGRPDDFGFDG